jgi:hypothetical protein
MWGVWRRLVVLLNDLLLVGGDLLFGRKTWRGYHSGAKRFIYFGKACMHFWQMCRL